MNKARAKKIYTLLGVLVVLCIITFAVTQYTEEQENISNTNEVVLSIDADSVTALSWEIDGSSYGFHYDSDSDTWLYDDDEAFPTSTDTITELLEVFADYEVEFIIEDVTDYEQYGLDDPVCTITITLDDGTVYEINLGDFSTLDSERYVEFGDGNVYLAVVDPYDSYDLELSDMIENDTIDTIDQANSITFTGLQDYSIYYEEDSTNTYCTEDVYFVEDGDLPLDSDSVESYLSTLSVTSLSEYVSYNASEEELEAYGFNDPLLVITVEYPYTDTDDDGEETRTLTLTIGVNQEELAEAVEDLEEDEEVDYSSLTTYIRVNDSQIIYELGSTYYEYLATCDYDDLRHTEVLATVFSDVYQFDFTIDGVTYTIYTEADDGETDRSYYYYYDGEVISEDDLEDDDDIENYRVEVDGDSLQDAIEDITAESFTDEETDGDLEISFVAYLDNENYEKVEVELYRYDGTYCLAVIDGEPVSLVLRTAVVELIETINAIVL